MNNDWAYWRACQDARDDAQMSQIYGIQIHRTDSDVEQEAQRYRLGNG